MLTLGFEQKRFLDLALHLKILVGPDSLSEINSACSDWRPSAVLVTVAYSPYSIQLEILLGHSYPALIRLGGELPY